MGNQPWKKRPRQNVDLKSAWKNRPGATHYGTEKIGRPKTLGHPKKFCPSVYQSVELHTMHGSLRSHMARVAMTGWRTVEGIWQYARSELEPKRRLRTPSHNATYERVQQRYCSTSPHWWDLRELCTKWNEALHVYTHWDAVFVLPSESEYILNIISIDFFFIFCSWQTVDKTYHGSIIGGRQLWNSSVAISYG